MEESEVKVAKIDAAMGLIMTKVKPGHGKEFEELRKHAIKFLKLQFDLEKD